MAYHRNLINQSIGPKANLDVMINPLTRVPTSSQRVILKKMELFMWLMAWAERREQLEPVPHTQ